VVLIYLTNHLMAVAPLEVALATFLQTLHAKMTGGQTSTMIPIEAVALVVRRAAMQMLIIQMALEDMAIGIVETVTGTRMAEIDMVDIRRDIMTKIDLAQNLRVIVLKTAPSAAVERRIEIDRLTVYQMNWTVLALTDEERCSPTFDIIALVGTT